MQWGYNFSEALEVYRWDSEVELFLKVLQYFISEDVYWGQVLYFNVQIEMYFIN